MSQNTAAVVAIATPKPSQSPVSMTQRIMALVFGRIHHPHVLQTVVAVAVSAKILLIFNPYRGQIFRTEILIGEGIN